jgi:positive regulator of sigma E activity
MQYWFRLYAMKPSVPETGKIIRIEGNAAVIIFESRKSCKGCGAAKIGLCKAGGISMFLTTLNTAAAKLGDEVIVGVDKKTQRLGYLLAYLIPLFGFIGGAIIGSFLGKYFAIPALDVVSAFILLGLSSAFSFSKLRELDRSHHMEVKRIVSAGEFTEFAKTEEERRYLSYADQ